jgi:hypothetical protein
VKRYILVLAFSIICLTSTAQTPKEQTTFCAEDWPQDKQLKPATLPGTVLEALTNTKDVRELQGATLDGRRIEIASLFKGAKVDLSSAHVKTFLVMGGFLMSGADNTWFWIVKDSGQKATILLKAGANCLNIRKGSSSGLRDIETVWSSPSYTITEIYAFDGTAYKWIRRKTHTYRP